MKSTVSYKTCEFYEPYSGEYFQGCWEFTDLCYISMEADMCYSSNCFENKGKCPFHYKKRGV